MSRFAVVALLPESVPGRLDFMSREFDSLDEIPAMLEQLEAAEPRWRVVSFCHAEDLPLLMEPSDELGPVGPTPDADHG